MNSFLLLALFLTASLAAQATILWLAARVCQLPQRGWGRSLLVTVIRFLVVVGLWVAIVGRDGDPAMVTGFWVAVLIADVVVTLALLRRLFGGSMGAVTRAWGVQLVAGIIVGVGLGALIQTCLAGYTVPASSMSPNIRGFHVVELLPDGNQLIVAANDPTGPAIPPGEPSGAVISETFEYRPVPRPAEYTAQADRILCNKTKFPARWDAVVFRYPEQPSDKYVKRLVGLPGETVEIREGAVWVNGDRQSPPARLGPIRYLGDFGLEGDDRPFGPVTLGADEYFVLGDNPNKSSDSRIWGPVKRDLIVGVADLIYWPPGRWRLRP